MDNKSVKQLDKLLMFFVERGAGSATPIDSIPVELQTNNLRDLLAILEHLKYVIPYSCDFRDGKPLVEFPNLLVTTPAGVYFALISSFTDEARIKKKERRLFNFKYFTMGWDTVIALIALIIAILALVKNPT